MTTRPGSTPLGFLPEVETDECAARRTLLDQIAKMERELSSLFCASFPRTGFEWGVASRGGPRLLNLSELEQLRDDLARRLEDTRRALSDRTFLEEQNRVLIERMMLEPANYKWVRVQNADIGLPGCKSWHVRPRLGIIGMLAGWWHVKISSGCPLATQHLVAANLRLAASSALGLAHQAFGPLPCDVYDAGPAPADASAWFSRTSCRVATEGHGKTF
ncbi:MAG: hypothetical protein H0V29_08045 [Thermoleophilaceae bacterium]|nr:hypothetical protein [Thermoleophilaceae bacterium]